MNVATDPSVELESYARLLVKAMAEHGRGETCAPPDGLGFIGGWAPARRERFLYGMAEALDAAFEQQSPAIVEAYVRYMSRADQPIPNHFRAGLSAEVADAFNRRNTDSTRVMLVARCVRARHHTGPLTYG